MRELAFQEIENVDGAFSSLFILRVFPTELFLLFLLQLVLV